MKHWREVTGFGKVLYLLAVLLPILGFFPFLLLPGLVPPGPVGGIVWLFLVPPALGLMLGAGNLILIFTGHPPRENRALWDGVLLVSLVPDLALLGFGAIIWLLLHGIWPAPT